MRHSALLLIAGFTCIGCYDGEQLVELARAEAIRTRLEEVDLGTYRTTMPRDAVTASVTEMEFRVFGNVPRYRIPEIEEQLETEGYRIRYATLTALRQAAPEDLADPGLTVLRERIAEVANEILKEGAIDSVGFADIRFVHH